MKEYTQCSFHYNVHTRECVYYTIGFTPVKVYTPLTKIERCTVDMHNPIKSGHFVHFIQSVNQNWAIEFLYSFFRVQD